MLHQLIRRVKRVIAPTKLRPPTSPKSIYDRWRSHSAWQVSSDHFRAVGLDSVWDRYPGKFDRQIVAVQCLRNVCRNNAQGAVVEFGCFLGHTAIQIVETLHELRDDSHVLLTFLWRGDKGTDNVLLVGGVARVHPLENTLEQLKNQTCGSEPTGPGPTFARRTSFRQTTGS